MSVLGWLLLPAVGIIAFFQLFFLVHSARVRIRATGGPTSDPVPDRRMSVVIPVFNDAATLSRCLDSLAGNDLRHCEKVVVVLDRCTDGSEEVARSFIGQFTDADVTLAVEHLPDGSAGKVAGLLHGGSVIDTKTALLLDADIALRPTALAELAEFHREHGEDFSTCLIFPRQVGGSLTSHVICNNRLYRQSVLQSVRARFGLANFPGGLQLVNYKKYRDVLEHGFLEDLTATYRVVADGGRVAVLPRVLAHETERQTIRGLFLQRTRWTLGTIQHLPVQVRTARTRSSPTEKILIHSFHVMWEFQYYVMVLAAIAAPWQGAAWPVFLLPYALYVPQILRSVRLTRRHYVHSPIGVVAHCALFPSVITAALVAALGVLAVKRRAFFTNVSLFRRN